LLFFSNKEKENMEKLQKKLEETIQKMFLTFVLKEQTSKRQFP